MQRGSANISKPPPTNKPGANEDERATESNLHFDILRRLVRTRMNLPGRPEAEHHGCGPAAKVVFQIFHAATLNAVLMSENVGPAAFISQNNFAL